MNYVPVEWPPWWKGKGKHFLEGFPFWGPHVSIIKSVRDILTNRTPEMFATAWNEMNEPIDKCHAVCISLNAIIAEYIKWPNCYFLPDDTSALLLGLIPGCEIESKDIIREIYNKMHKNASSCNPINQSWFINILLRPMNNSEMEIQEKVIEGKFIKLYYILSGL